MKVEPLLVVLLLLSTDRYVRRARHSCYRLNVSQQFKRSNTLSGAYEMYLYAYQAHNH